MQHPEALTLSAELIGAGLVIVCEHWGAPAGFVVVVPREEGEAELGGPYVEPDLWRTGIGRALVEEAAQFATALECAALVAVATPLAEPFYLRCGFRPGGARDTAHGPVAVMQRNLVNEPAEG